MPNKQLTAKVRLNTTQAEKSIDNLTKKINRLDKLMNKVSNGNNQQNQRYAKTQRQVDGIANKVRAWANAQKQVSSNTKSTSNALSDIGGKLKAIAATYLGIMGTRAVMDTTDLLVGAQNRLNYVNANSLGESGYNSDGTYSADTLNATQEALDKMYASSQKVRTSYQDMISNVSKTMSLAGDAFHDNIDNAIRFQEIMAEAYSVGGASAQEQNTSMYQLTQALGSGYLQGDELRSVREGAPLAYKAIEDFAQGVYNTTDSLKDMASEGKITSEMVVAAVMNMGDSIDNAFAQTKQTFGQTIDQIKNSALYAFQPVMEKLSETLNTAIESGLVQKFEILFTNLAKSILIVVKVVENAIDWIADNWDWLQFVVYGVIAALIAYLGKLAVASMVTAVTSFVAFLVNNPFVLWIVGIALLLAALAWMLTQCENACDFIVQLAMIVANAIVAILAIVLIAYLATGAVMLSIPTLIALLIIGIIAILLALFIQFTGEIIGCVLGTWEVIKAVCEWIDNGWHNMCNNMAAWFWNAVADMLEGVEWLLNGVNKIREALGYDAIDIGEIRAKAESYERKVVENDLNIGSAWDKGYAEGSAIGEGIQNKINSYGEELKNLLNGSNEEEEKTSLLDEIGKKLGLDFSGMTTPFPSNGAGSGYSPDYEKLLGGIGDDTEKIADNMDLTAEDLEYLRRIADMEWKKEFTTAEIKVEMNNSNTINGENDLDGLVTKLSDKLYEELNAVADGVYA